MATKQFNTRVQHKIDTYENWNKAENFIPLKGELIIYATNERGDSISAFKLGDGVTNVINLPFVYEEKAQVQFITWEADD